MAARVAKRKHPAGISGPVAVSLLGHGVLLLIILFGGFTVHRAPPPTQLAIKATLVDPLAIPRPAPAPEPVSPVPPVEEPRVVEPPPPVETPKPAVEDPAEAAAPLAEAERQKEQEKRAAKVAAERAAERLQAERLLKDQQEKQAQQAADQKAKEKAEQDKAAKEKAEKQKLEKERAEKDKLEKEREAKAAALREKAEAERRRKEAAARDLARQLAEEEERFAAVDSGALQAYVDLIAQKVTRNWLRPPSAQVGLECDVVVAQIPGGEVTGVRVENCAADDAVRRSIEAAVLKASPLPLPDDPSLFERNLRFIFKPQQ